MILISNCELSIYSICKKHSSNNFIWSILLSWYYIPSGADASTPLLSAFRKVRVAQSLVWCVVLYCFIHHCLPLCPCYLCHCIACPSLIYGFYLSFSIFKLFYMTWKMCIIFRSAYWLTPQTRRKLKWYILYSAWSRHIFVPVPGIRFSTPFVVVYFMFIEFIWGMTVLFVDISLNCWQALCKLSFHKIYLSYLKGDTGGN